LREQPAPGVRRLRLNRAESRNAFDAELREALYQALDEALADDGVRAVVLAGSPKYFSGGGDIASMEGLDTDGARARMAAGHRLVRRLAAAEKPVLGSPSGWTVGASVGLLLLCDELIAGRSVRFALPFLGLAVMPDWGLSRTLSERVGPAVARRLLLRKEVVDAEEALRIGLVDELCEDETLDERALARAIALAALPRGAFASTKRLLNQGRDLEAALTLEAADQVANLVSADAVEGRRAFFEKRDPTY
jgi:2-(1,2-epoxy-1,2-dihydrophenyl)acetyl-CoA isomerase